MLADQQSKIGVFRMFRRILIAMAVYRHDPVRVLADDCAMRVHAEGSHKILELLRPVDDLALIQLIGQMAEHDCRKLHPHADIDPVALGRDPHFPADPLHPFAAAPADRDHALRRCENASVLQRHGISVFHPGNVFYRCAEMEIHLVFQFLVNVAEYDVIDIRSQVAHLCVQQMQAVLQAGFPDLRVRSGVKLCCFAAVFQVDLIHIAHQLERPGLPHMLMEAPAEIIGDIVFPVGECTGAAESAHDRAGFAPYAAPDLFPVDRAFAFIQRISQFEHADLHWFPGSAGQFIGCEDPSGSCPDDQNIIIHFCSILSARSDCFPLRRACAEASADFVDYSIET